jgi:pimeloyl-ACP methyl ester carboxylesterase
MHPISLAAVNQSGTKKFLATVFVLSGLCGAVAAPTPADYKAVNSGVKYQFIGEYGVDRLNKILTDDVAKFSSFAMTYPLAENPVKLYKVVYNTVIPEDNNRPVQVSGLMAVPMVKAASLPMVSYQHGTVFSRTEVPSSPEESMETRLLVARFAGRGYLVVAADYIGKGISNEPDAWLVKEASAQVCLDMLLAAKAVCADLNLTPGDLFLSGWSQGSFSTSAFLNRLETIGIPVKAAAMASAPNDIYLCFNRWINVPSDLDVHWLVATASMMVNAYENYYDLPGLSATSIKPKYWQTARDLYNNTITWEQAEKILPAKSKDLFQEDFISQCAQASNRYSKQMLLNRSYDWRFKTPTHYYYGQIDEVVTPAMVKLPVEYQTTLGGAEAQAIFAGEKADHRGTFLFAVKDQKDWFDQLRSR